MIFLLFLLLHSGTCIKNQESDQGQGITHAHIREQKGPSKAKQQLQKGYDYIKQRQGQLPSSQNHPITYARS